MFKIALVSLVLLPLAARADPTIGPRLDPTPIQHAYEAPPPDDSTGARASGWGLRASVNGRWVDLRTRSLDWATDSDVPASDVQAGVEWRRGGAAAVLGYGQFDTGVDKDPRQWDRLIPQDRTLPGDPGVLGLNLVLRSR
jgi:hypothetical protein